MSSHHHHPHYTQLNFNSPSKPTPTGWVGLLVCLLVCLVTFLWWSSGENWHVIERSSQFCLLPYIHSHSSSLVLLIYVIPNLSSSRTLTKYSVKINIFLISADFLLKISRQAGVQLMVLLRGFHDVKVSLFQHLMSHN